MPAICQVIYRCVCVYTCCAAQVNYAEYNRNIVVKKRNSSRQIIQNNISRKATGLQPICCSHKEHTCENNINWGEKK